VKRLFDELVLVWAAALITWVVSRVFSQQPPDIPGSGGTVAALSLVIGLLGTAVAFYKWFNRRRGDDDREDVP
jgi:hypothetical protein